MLYPVWANTDGILFGIRDEESPRERTSLTLKSSCSDVVAWIPANRKPAIVLQVVSQSFIDVQKNFMMVMEDRSSFDRENLYLMCLDRKSTAAMKRVGVTCVPIRRVSTLRQVWVLRVHVLTCLSGTGEDVLLSDSDALWLRDPIVDMALDGVIDSDILVQRGSFPRLLGQKWGVTMCMGFALFRSRGGGHGMSLYQQAMKKYVLWKRDDQIALNEAAETLGVVWDSDSDMRYLPSTEIGRGVVTGIPGGNFTIILLPHNKYTRRCDSSPISDETVIAHCRARKEGGEKESWMVKANVWLVGNSSETVTNRDKKSSP